MSEINLWFPVAIYTESNILTDSEHTKLLNHIEKIKETTPSGGKEWFGSIYTSFETYDLLQDQIFNTLLDKINTHVKEYADVHQSDYDYKCTEAWFNESIGGQFQEFHTHAGHVISAVYYLKAPEGSGDIVFKDPKQPDMMPMKNINQLGDLTFGATSYKAIENSLIIFRSYLPHMVRPGTNETGRISIALNYC